MTLRVLLIIKLLQYSDMDEDIKLEAVELTVTALERFPTHYEVCYS